MTLGKLIVALGVDMAEFDAKMKTASDRIRNAGAGWGRVGSQLSLGLTAPIVGVGSAALVMAGKFQTSMLRVEALTGATGVALERLRSRAQELGATTQYTAGQVADGMAFMAMAGFNAAEILGAIPSVLQLAAAGQVDLARSADITTNILTGYGMRVDELGRANDVLVKTFTSTNTNLEMLGESFKYAGPVAKAAGMEFEETAAILGLMGNAGIQASMAGTSLRGAIVRLLNPTGDAVEILKKIPSVIDPATGKMRSMIGIFSDLEKAGLHVAEIMELFGLRAGPASAALLGMGANAITELREKLDAAGGTAERIARVQMSGLLGAWYMLKSAAESVSIAFVDAGVMDWIGTRARQLAELVRAFGRLDSGTRAFIIAAGLMLASLGPLALTIWAVTKSLAVLAGAIGATGAFFGGWSVAVKLALADMALFNGGIAGMRVALNTLFLTAPGAMFLLVAAALVSVALAAKAVYDNWRIISYEAGRVRDAFVGAVKSMVAPVVDYLTPSIRVFAYEGRRYIEFFSRGWGVLVRTVVDFGKRASQAWRDVMASADPFAAGIRAIKFEVGQMVDAVLGAFKRMADGIKKAVFGELKESWDEIGRMTEWVADKFWGMFDAVVGHSYVPDMVNGIRDEFKRLDSVMVATTGRAVDATTARFRALGVGVDIAARVLERFGQTQDILRGLRMELMFETDKDAAARLREEIARLEAELRKLGGAVNALNAVKLDPIKLEFTEPNLRDITVLQPTVPQTYNQNIAFMKRLAETVKPVVDGFVQITPRMTRFEESLWKAEIAARGVGKTIGDAFRGAGQKVVDLLKSAFNPLTLITNAVSEAFSKASQSLQPFMQAIGRIAEVLITALQPILDAIVPVLVTLAPIFRILGQLIQAFVVPIIKLLNGVLRAIFPIIKILAIGLTYLGQIVFNIAGGIAKAIGSFLRALGKAINALLPGSPANPLVRMGNAMNNFGNEALRAAGDMAVARDEIRRTNLDDSLNSVATAADNVTRSMANVPQGYKLLQLRQFEAARGEPARQIVPRSTQTVTVYQFGEITIRGNFDNPRDMLRALKAEADRQGRSVWGAMVGPRNRWTETV